MAAVSPARLSLFVRKIPWTVASNEMREYFRKFGPVKKCVLPFDYETGFHRGYCFVEFYDAKGMQKALESNPHIIEGAEVEVSTRLNSKKSNTDQDPELV
ncbi:hypothetical protein DNTS_009856 [Danionella cerebrum]|uniref:RRM domain-containing protein n=1 Tax=Danionella cerebrum TaxID=2873325 RepID=A0A553NMB9_9TELE|nr:hypothetical protein DNTS_009856 [Danionella translucida]